jgi:AAA+ ATPase superfamily predicted ATPase
MKKPATPFPITGYYGPEYFCDREQETKVLLGNISGGQSTVLTAMRRIGKTSLIMHVLNRLPSGTRGIYLDILPTENLNDFLNELATAVIRDVSERKGPGRKLWDFIKSLRPSLSFDVLTGAPQVTFSVRENEINIQIETILKFLEAQDEKIVVAIDEFQQILTYPEKNTDAWLRRIIQQMKNVVFIFSGSQQHLMKELFTVPSRPFYNSAGMLRIDKIPRTEYSAFIIRKFAENKRKINQEIVDELLKWTEGHTYYLQLLCNRVFLRNAMEIKEEIWKEEAARLLSEQEPVFLNYRSMITVPQWSLLKAIAHEGDLFEPTGQEFIMKYRLGNGSTVLRSMKALLRMELIYYDYTSESRKYYKINDLLLRRWIEGRE